MKTAIGQCILAGVSLPVSVWCGFPLSTLLSSQTPKIRSKGLFIGINQLQRVNDWMNGIMSVLTSQVTIVKSLRIHDTQSTVFSWRQVSCLASVMLTKLNNTALQHADVVQRWGYAASGSSRICIIQVSRLQNVFLKNVQSHWPHMLHLFIGVMKCTLYLRIRFHPLCFLWII